MPDPGFQLIKTTWSGDIGDAAMAERFYDNIAATLTNLAKGDSVRGKYVRGMLLSTLDFNHHEPRVLGRKAPALLAALNQMIKTALPGQRESIAQTGKRLAERASTTLCEDAARRWFWRWLY